MEGKIAFIFDNLEKVDQKISAHQNEVAEKMESESDETFIQLDDRH